MHGHHSLLQKDNHQSDSSPVCCVHRIEPSVKQLWWCSSTDGTFLSIYIDVLSLSLLNISQRSPSTWISYIFWLDSWTDSPELLHVSTNSQHQASVNTQRPDICTCLTTQPKYSWKQEYIDHDQFGTETLLMFIILYELHHPQLTKLVFRLKLDEFTLINCSDSELSLDSRD